MNNARVLLVTSNNGYTCKLADFGLSKDVGSQITGQRGTPGYAKVAELCQAIDSGRFWILTKNFCKNRNFLKVYKKCVFSGTLP